LDKGKALYQTNCATCHGASGVGDGVAGTNLNPRPADIARFSKMPMASDSYLYWTIAEGGAPVKSAMPPFKAQLEELEIWQIITYLRNL
jgi:mono/diheme cytochrome c family protein